MNKVKQEKNKIINTDETEYFRSGLEDTLTGILDKPLMLVIAPSGYGKSTLIRQYFAKRQELSCKWFHFQREEMDENWIWRRFCNKIAEHNSQLYTRLTEVELPASLQEMAYVIRILKKYIQTPLYLIMDDYQECHSRVLDGMIEILAKEDTSLHIILISRVYPEIPYDELFLKGRCMVLNQKNLTLTREETDYIFKANHVDLVPGELEQIYKYTDGWISAVYLCLYEYQKNGQIENFYSVSNLLKTAIFDKLTQKMKEFYMKVSLFDWFDLKGAAYVTEMEIVERTLFETIQKFGFVQYDRRTKSFVMHTLLRSVAEAELEKSGIDIMRLYRRAGEWAEKRGAFIQAVRYYKKAECPDNIAFLYAGENGKNLIDQAPEVFENVKEMIIPAMWEHSLMALLNYLYYCALKEAPEKTLPFYDTVMREVSESSKWSSDKRIQGELAVIRSAIQFNDLEKMNKSLSQACNLLGYGTSALLGNALLTYGTTCMTVLYYNRSGGLKYVIEQEKQYAKYYMHLTKGGQEGWDEFFDAEYALMTGDMEKAYRLAEQVCRQTSIRNQTCIVISTYYIILRCLLYYGKCQEFEKKIQEMDKQLEDITNPLLIADMELAKGYVYACLGRKDDMAEWLRDFKLENCSRQIRSVRSGCMTYGRLLCAGKNWEMLDIVGNEMLVPYESAVHIQTFITGNIYKAIAKYHLGQKDLAINYLKEAIGLAEPDHLILPFWENSMELAQIINGEWSCEFLEEIRPYAVRYEKGLQKFRADNNSGESIRLTKREKELMEYVRQGFRNAEISDKMHIAQVTVEKNLTSIYRKLDVTNRTAAIMKWQELSQKV